MADMSKILKLLESKGINIDRNYYFGNRSPTDSALNPVIQQACETAWSKLVDKDGNPTLHFQAYIRFEEEYKRKLNARDESYTNAFNNPMELQNWPITGKIYSDAVDKAMDRWLSLGFKEEIENAIAILLVQNAKS